MKIKDIIRQLSVCDYYVNDEDWIQVMINVLNKDYDIIHANISGRDDTVIVKEVISSC